MYVFDLGLNGVTEAFVYSIAGSDKRSVHKLTVAHGIIGILFYIFAPLFVRYGTHFGIVPTIGFIAAKYICMVLRIVYSFVCASRFFEGDSRKLAGARLRNYQSVLTLIRQCSSHPFVLLGFMLSYFITGYSLSHIGPAIRFASIRNVPRRVLQHVSVGIACASGNIGTIIIFETRFMQELRSTFGYNKWKKKD